MLLVMLLLEIGYAGVGAANKSGGDCCASELEENNAGVSGSQCQH